MSRELERWVGGKGKRKKRKKTMYTCKWMGGWVGGWDLPDLADLKQTAASAQVPLLDLIQSRLIGWAGGWVGGWVGG